jgi:tetratricopeptide (TPR) repeat protein
MARIVAFGPDHPDIGKVVNNMADLLAAMGNLTDAEPAYRRSLAIYEKAMGQEHHLVGKVLGNLASVYSSQERYAEAEPLYKQASLSTKRRSAPITAMLDCRSTTWPSYIRAKNATQTPNWSTSARLRSSKSSWGLTTQKRHSC